jgi:hypothetical protein
VDNLSLKEGFVCTSGEVDIEKLEGFVERILGKVPTELDIALAASGERDVHARVEAGDGWCVNDECTSRRHREGVEGDGAVGERSEGLLFGGR